jgi:hypothetical protein
MNPTCSSTKQELWHLHFLQLIDVSDLIIKSSKPSIAASLSLCQLRFREPGDGVLAHVLHN